MIFNDGYYHPLDREYSQAGTPDSKEIIEPIEKPIIVKQDPNKLTTADVGTTVLMDRPNAESVKARVRHGASRLELVFPGKGKSSQNALNPETYGKTERQDIRDVARVNELKLSTHASLQINGLSGLGQKGFSEEARREALDEIKRAIDFAADATTGGAVVVHTGEFPRSIAGYYGEEGVRPDGAKFEGYENEEKEAMHILVDEKSGSVIQNIREDTLVWMPEQEDDPTSPDGKKWLKIPDFATGKEKEVRFEIINTYIDKIRTTLGENSEEYKRAKERFKDKIPVFKEDDKGNIQTKAQTFSQFKRKFIKENQNKFIKEKGKTVDAEDAAVEFFLRQQEAELHQALGTAREYEEYYTKGRSARELMKEKFQEYFKSQKITDSEKRDKEKARIRQELSEELGGHYGRHFINPKVTFDQAFKKSFEENERMIAHGRESSTGGRLRARQIQDGIVHVVPIEEYAIKKTAKTLAQAGIFAWEKTKAANQKLKSQGLEQIEPVYISPENLFQQSFGSHPEELKTIVQKSRKEMVNRLVEGPKKMNRDEAVKLAEKHIVGTFDIGHAHMWKKYYGGKDEDFNKWLINQAKDLIKQGIIKHIHISDNLGYHDEHLKIGDGTAPIKELIREVEKAGLKDVIIEPGSTNVQTIWPDSMKELGSPIYAASSGYHRGFDQVHQSFAGYGNPTYFLVGPTVPDEEQWKLWSGVLLE